VAPTDRHKSAVSFEIAGRGAKVEAAASVRLSSTTFWWAPAFVFKDLTSRASYIGSIIEQVFGDHIESFHSKENLPGLYFVEHQLCLQDQSLGLYWPSAASYQ
jgi:hypothetical protein